MFKEDNWQKLAEIPVPPPPIKFDADLHQRINKRLLIGQIFDLFFCVTGHAVLHFGRAVVALVMYTITGQFQSKPRKRPDESP